MMLGCFISSAWLFQGQNSRAKEFRVWECLGFVFLSFLRVWDSDSCSSVFRKLLACPKHDLDPKPEIQS